LEAIRSSLGPEDDPGPIEREIAVARLAHQEASHAARRIANVAQRIAALQRSQVNTAEAQINAARADLARRTGELSSYRSAARGGTGAMPAESSGSRSWLGDLSMAEVDVTAADFSDNPILSKFGRGGAGLADYRWAVQTWDEVVRPGLARGMTRDDFQARDAERDAPPLRRTADVYDIFLHENQRLLLTRTADGRLTVDNGRHRLQVARDLGIQTLPAQVS
jgi:hypothetical protein